ncbi:MAG: SagB/ThcOx family dehydrogenase [Acidithiobacillus sp.]
MGQNITARNAITLIHAYHERSKHRLDAYAAGPDFLDWDDQPDPFRTFCGTESLALPLAPGQPHTPYAQLFAGHGIPPSPLDLPHLALLLEVSLGLSAWKAHADQRWSLRCNPSSGNLHPTEAYLICPDLPGLAGGVHHYHSLDHALERRLIPGKSWGQSWPVPGTLLGLSSIYWREAWKYGERAYRYCQHDVGHALAAIRLAAASLGWETVLLNDWGDDAIAHLLGADRYHEFPEEEREAPEALLWIGPTRHRPESLPLLQAVDAGRWAGQARQLSPEHLHWAVIGEADAAARKGFSASAAECPLAPLPPLRPVRSDCSAGRIFRQRRSAQRFDTKADGLPTTDFLRILDALLPRPGVPPFDLLPWAPAIHPLLFVHRVEGLDPGCYVLPRHPGIEDRLRGSLRADFLWQNVAGVPDHIPLRLLWRGDSRDFVRTLCCRQVIASQSLFTVAMLAEFAPRLEEGAWWYRWLHWEAGLLGQSLYLEAEAATLRGTGIGCFFDDELHQWLGLVDRQFQSLYHFTVGRAVDDPRLSLLPPYAPR